MKHFATPLILIAILAGVGSWYWFVEKDKPAGEPIKEMSVDLWDLKKEDIEKVEIDFEGRGLTVEKGEKGDWRIASPTELPAGESEVDSLLWTVANIAAAARSEMNDEQKKNLEPFGLDDPGIRLKLTLKGGETKGLLIGAESPISDLGRYAMKEGDDASLYVIGLSKIEGLDKEPNDLRDKKFVKDFERDKVKSISIQPRAGAGVVCIKGEEDKWTFQANAGKECGKEAKSLLSSIEFLRVKSFLDEQPESESTVGLSPPETRVALSMGEDGAELALEFGVEDDDGLYARRPADGLIVKVFPSIFSDIDNLRKAISRIESDDDDDETGAGGLDGLDLKSIHGIDMGSPPEQ